MMLNVRNNRGSSIEIPFLANAPCPCQSGRRYDHCHGRNGSAPSSSFKLRLPPDPRTGIANPKCYMRHTCDCDPIISGEHYLSAAILKQFGQLRSIGLPGRLDQMDSIPLDALRANVLCRRHNAALSPLDTAAGHAFSQILAARENLFNPERNRRRERHFLVDGYAIELWCLKTLLALHEGGITRVNGQKTSTALSFDVEAAVETLFSGQLQAPYGLYLDGSIRPRGVGASIAALSHNGTLVGIQVQLIYVRFSCIFPPTPTLLTDTERNIYRLRIGRYHNKEFRSLIHFAWNGINVGDSLYNEELDLP